MSSSITGASSAKGTYPGMKDVAEPGRKYFRLHSHIDNFLGHFVRGVIFALPVITSYFSIRCAVAVVILELLSWYVGTLIVDFEYWYNSEVIDNAKGIKESKTPETEIEIILSELGRFEAKYGVTFGSMYRWLDEDAVPFENLDWLETVYLLNQLSLHVGKRFETVEEDSKKGTVE